MHRGSNILLGGIVAAVLAAAPAQAQPTDCTATAASIRKAESELPRLDAAPPGDKQIVCITLETLIVFARRFDAHVAQCPRSPHAQGSMPLAQFYFRTTGTNGILVG